MRLLITTTDYNVTINLAKKMDDGIKYSTPVIYHCYWNGTLNEKHYYSIKSCYYFNVYKNKNNKIILWLEGNVPNEYYNKIKEYAEIRYFSLSYEKKNTGFISDDFYYNTALSYYSDVVRYLLLYNYGGCWFDLDCFFLRNFDSIFYYYGDEICVYQWENKNFPNGAIYISLVPKSSKMKAIIELIIDRGKGWGFHEAQLTYDLPMDLLVLPCSWFDPDWIPNPYNLNAINHFHNTYNNGVNSFFVDTDKKVDFDHFHKGSFCYHWHNRWNDPVGDTSSIKQLVRIIDSFLESR